MSQDVGSAACRLSFSQSQPLEQQQEAYFAPSQVQPTPTTALAAQLHNVQLCSQVMTQLTQEVTVSQLSYLGTQDFSTPADAAADYHPNRENVHDMAPSPGVMHKQKRSRLSILPNCSQPDCSQPGLSQDTFPNSSLFNSDGPPVLQRLPSNPGGGLLRRDMRIRSPPCHHNTFLHGPPDEQDKAAKTVPRGNPPTSIFRQLFKNLGTAGCGNFNKVFKAQHRLDGKEYAVKCNKRAAVDKVQQQMHLQEIQCMAALGDHPNLVSMRMSWSEPEDDGIVYYIAMELCGEQLSARLNCREEFTLMELLKVLEQVAKALQHMHQKGIAHCDVKPDNIFVMPDGTCKLGDFGQATFVAPSQQAALAARDDEEGDKRYLAAEVLKGDRTRLDKADIFALGASLYELALLSPLPQEGPRYQDLREGKLGLLPGRACKLRKLLLKMMDPDPDKRPTAQDIVSSRMLKEMQGEAAALEIGPCPLQRPSAVTRISNGAWATQLFAAQPSIDRAEDLVDSPGQGDAMEEDPVERPGANHKLQQRVVQHDGACTVSAAGSGSQSFGSRRQSSTRLDVQCSLQSCASGGLTAPVASQGGKKQQHKQLQFGGLNLQSTRRQS